VRGKNNKESRDEADDMASSWKKWIKITQKTVVRGGIVEQKEGGMSRANGIGSLLGFKTKSKRKEEDKWVSPHENSWEREKCKMQHGRARRLN